MGNIDMVGSINNGGFQQPPASRAFDSGQAPQNPVDPNQQQARPPQAPQGIKAPDTFTGPTKTEEVNQQTALSRDASRIDANQISPGSSSRGTLLDIKI